MQPVAARDVLSPSVLISNQVDAAHERRVPITGCFTIAGAPATIAADATIAGALTEPFEHLRSSGAAGVELRIRATTMTDDVAAKLDLDALPQQGVVNACGDSVIHLVPDCAAVLDRRCGTIDAVMRDAGGMESWRRAKPLQLLLSIFFADRGVDLVHAAAVSLEGRGLLLAGAGGSGKSTVSIAALLDGFSFLGDDCVGMRETAEGFEALSVFGSGCLEELHAARFPQLAAKSNGADSKAVIPFGSLFSGRVIASTPVYAVVLPRVSGASDVTIGRITAAEALLALAPSSIIRRATPARATFGRLARMLRQVPAFRLEMGPVERIGSCLRDLTEELA